jgi:hypothetical protein
LKLRYDTTLSSFAFNFNLRSYDEGETWTEPESTGVDTPDSKTQLLQLMGKQHSKAGAYIRPLFGST